MKKYWKSIVCCIAIVVAIIAGVKGCNVETPQQVESKYQSEKQDTSTDSVEKVDKSDESEVKTVEDKNISSPEEVKQDSNAPAAENKSLNDKKQEDVNKTPNTNPSTSTSTSTSTETKDTSLYCIISITCESILNNKESFKKDINIVPKDGVIYPETKIAFKEGESAFDALKRAKLDGKFNLGTKSTNIDNGVYIMGIGDIYEFDCGKSSGWQYFVNGEYINKSVSNYLLKSGDKIQFKYTCDYGNDLK